jgi:sec-independent protein translocase protein TatB
VEIFNIGIPELLLILLLMLILLGPDEMITTARTAARLIRKFTRSSLWNDIVKTQREIRDIPTRLVREAGFDEIRGEVDQARLESLDAFRSASIPHSADEMTILPPNNNAAKERWAKEQPPSAPVTLNNEVEQEERSSKWAGLTGDHKL